MGRKTQGGMPPPSRGSAVRVSFDRAARATPRIDRDVRVIDRPAYFEPARSLPLCAAPSLRHAARTCPGSAS